MAFKVKLAKVNFPALHSNDKDHETFPIYRLKPGAS
jgi:hypothetical protein